MTMTAADIVKDYRESKNKKMQIGILADLNLTSKEEIEDILVNAGEMIPKRRKKEAETESEEHIPECVISLVFDRISELDKIIEDATREYKELTSFLRIGVKNE